MAIDFKKSYYVLLCESLYNISLKYALFYLWVFYWINLKCTSPGFATEWEVILFFFLIFNFGNPAEIRTLTMVWTKKGNRAGGGVQHACMYISEPFLNVKAVHFWEVLNFFVSFFPSSILQWASFIYSKQFENTKICEVHLKKPCSIALVQYTKRLW